MMASLWNHFYEYSMFALITIQFQLMRVGLSWDKYCLKMIDGLKFVLVYVFGNPYNQ